MKLGHPFVKESEVCLPQNVITAITLLKIRLKNRLLPKKSTKFPTDLVENTTTKTIVLKILVFGNTSKQLEMAYQKRCVLKPISKKEKVDLI